MGWAGGRVFEGCGFEGSLDKYKKSIFCEKMKILVFDQKHQKRLNKHPTELIWGIWDFFLKDFANWGAGGGFQGFLDKNEKIDFLRGKK